jgi:hypothetical protein
MPVQDVPDSGDMTAVNQVSDAAADSTPVIVTAAIAGIAGSVALVVFLHFGPGISGIRGMVRGIFIR